MKIHEARQGTEEWEHARLGIPSASCFGKIVTPKLAPADNETSRGYLHKLLAEWVTGIPEEMAFGARAAMDRGLLMEPDARRWYEWTQGVETTEVGFCLTDNLKAGCSPDFLVGDDGGGEIKTPMAPTFMAYRLGQKNPYAEYRHQIQGALWLTKRKWWDLIIYHPDMEPIRRRYEPEPSYQDALTEAIYAFVARLEELKQQLRDEGDDLALDRIRRNDPFWRDLYAS